TDDTLMIGVLNVPKMDSPRLVSSRDIAAAYPAIRAVVHHTPLTTCGSLAERCGVLAGSLCFKMENLQRTGSFKIRGAYHRLSRLSDAEKSAGVVAASAGNHAQGVALAARLTGVRAT